VLVRGNGLQRYPAVWIDGELVRYSNTVSSPPVENDAANNPTSAGNLPPLNGGTPTLQPFGTATDAAVFGRAAYLYAYGGRLNPHPNGLGFVLSTTRPRRDGKPSANLSVSPYGAGTISIMDGAVFICPVHVGNSNGAAGAPNTGVGAVLQHSWSTDVVQFSHPIALWQRSTAAPPSNTISVIGAIANLNIPALPIPAGTAGTTLNLTSFGGGFWLPDYSGSQSSMVQALLVEVWATAEAATTSEPAENHRIALGKPDGGGLGIMRETELWFHKQANLPVSYGVCEQRWIEMNSLGRYNFIADLALVYSPAGGIAALNMQIGVVGYRVRQMARGRM
jgi:hypothetical protein